MLPEEDDLHIQIESVEPWEPPAGQHGRGLLLRTTRGDIRALLHHKEGTAKAIVWVWGARGGFDGPGEGLYGILAEELKSEVTSLRIDYRRPGVLHESVLDTIAGVSFLTATGHDEIILVGHSFGGAVVISAAPLSPAVTAVAALSSQTAGATGASKVSPRPLLLVHGADDTRLPVHCSELIHEWAHEPKELVIYPGAEHGLRECKEELRGLMLAWLRERLALPDAAAK